MGTLATILLILFAIFSSGMASFVAFNYMERRDQKIRDRIDEIDSQEEFLEKMRRDQDKLNLSTYTAILLALCVVFVALALISGGLALDLSPNVMKYVFLICAWLFMVAGGICFYHFRALHQIGNFDQTRKKFEQEKSSLEDRLR